MSLLLSSMREIALKRPLERVVGEAYAEEYALIEGTIQPLSGRTAAQMYGEKLVEMRLLLTYPDVILDEGMGLCVEVEPTAPPDFKVVYVPEWDMHTAAHIQYIPPEQR